MKCEWVHCGDDATRVHELTFHGFDGDQEIHIETERYCNHHADLSLFTASMTAAWTVVERPLVATKEIAS